MLSIDEILDSYTVDLALCLRTHFFFEELLAGSNTKGQEDMIERSRRKFYKGLFVVESLMEYFKVRVIKDALRTSTATCLRHAENRCSKDKSLDPCSVCLERGANYYIIHRGTAHKCVCSTCAMKIAITSNPKCPICREGVCLIAESAPETIKCCCGKPGCYELLLMRVKQTRVVNKLFDRCKATVECTTCTLEKVALEENGNGNSVVYRLYR